jgi:hypothetical protein
VQVKFWFSKNICFAELQNCLKSLPYLALSLAIAKSRDPEEQTTKKHSQFHEIWLEVLRFTVKH